jgi:hypothetical protein
MDLNSLVKEYGTWGAVAIICAICVRRLFLLHDAAQNARIAALEKGQAQSREDLKDEQRKREALDAFIRSTLVRLTTTGHERELDYVRWLRDRDLVPTSAPPTGAVARPIDDITTRKMVADREVAAAERVNHLLREVP